MEYQQIHSSLIYAYSLLHSCYMFRRYFRAIFMELTPDFFLKAYSNKMCIAVGDQTIYLHRYTTPLTVTHCTPYGAHQTMTISDLDRGRIEVCTQRINYKV
jgi:hypothetical protein